MDFSHIRLSPAYILRCNGDWNVIENVITKPKDFLLETKKLQIERQVGFLSQQSGCPGYPYNFGVTVKTSSSIAMEVHDFGNWNNKVTSEYFFGEIAIGKCLFGPQKKAANFGGKIGSHFMELFSGRKDVLKLKKWKAMKSCLCAPTGLFQRSADPGDAVFGRPYVIARKHNPLDFQIQVDRFGTTKPVHHDKLQKYCGDNPPAWVVKVSRRVKQNAQNWIYSL